MQHGVLTKLAPLLAVLGCAAHGLRLVPDPQQRSALWLAALETVAQIDSVREGVICLEINHGSAAWGHTDYRPPDSLLVQQAANRGLTIVPASSCRTPQGALQPRRGSTPAYHVSIEAGELTRQRDGVRLRVPIYPVDGCQGRAYYVFTWQAPGWKLVSESLQVICM